MVALPYVLAFFVSPTLAALVRLAALTSGQNILGRIAISVVEGAVAVGISAGIFYIFHRQISVLMLLILAIAYLVNDWRRVRKSVGMLVAYRVADLCGDMIGIASAGYLFLGV